MLIPSIWKLEEFMRLKAATLRYICLIWEHISSSFLSESNIHLRLNVSIFYWIMKEIENVTYTEKLNPSLYGHFSLTLKSHPSIACVFFLVHFCLFIHLSVCNLKLRFPLAQMTWKVTLSLAFQSLGIVYGDLGTSPLYVFTGIFPDGIKNNDDILGIFSLIIYSIIMIPMFKYVFIVLWANDHGNGKIFTSIDFVHAYYLYIVVIHPF